MIIKVKEYIDRLNDFAKAGSAVFNDASNAIRNEDIVTFDMEEQDAVSTVFLNASFGKLIDTFGLERIKRSFKFTNMLKTQMDRIRKYFADYEEIYVKK